MSDSAGNAGVATALPERTRVLVTGATGLVGNNVVRLLLARGVVVRVLLRDRSPASRRCLEGLDVDVVSGDVTDAASLPPALDGISAVVHAAGCVLLGWRNAALHESVNHLGARNVARAARGVGARMLLVSTVNALGVGARDRPADEESSSGPNVPCPYVLSKQAGERAVRAEMEKGLDAVIVQPGLMFGPWDWKPSSGPHAAAGGTPVHSPGADRRVFGL